MTKRFNLIRLSFLVVLGMLSNQMIAQLACSDNLNLSLDLLGEAIFSVDMAEEGNNQDYESKWVVPSLFTCDDLGLIQDYTLYGQYANGDIDSCMGTVSVADFISPVVIVETNVSVDLGDDGTLDLLPAMIDEGSYDNCSDITYDISPSTIDCDSPNPTVAVLTITDESGNTNQAWTNIFWNQVAYSEEVACNEISTLNVINGSVTLSLDDVLLSGSSACVSDYSFIVEYEDIVEPDVTFDISDIDKTYDVIVLEWITGLVCEFSFTVISGNAPYSLCAQDYSGKGIVEVEMTTGAFTDETGCTSVSQASGTVITPSKDGSASEGIDIIDYTIMRSQILGASSMNADQMLAADLSETPGNVSTLDLVFLEKMMTGEFVPEKVWIFRDASETFPDNQVPLNYSETIELANQEDYEFVAIKLGDLDLSFEEVISEDDMASLIVEDIVLNQGESYSVPLKLENDQQLVAVNMFIRSETDAYEITNVTSNLPEYTYNAIEDNIDGILNLVWEAEDETISAGGHNLLADDPIFILELKAKKNSILSETFAIATDKYSKVLNAESYKGTALDVDIQDVITVPVHETEAFDHLEISPNPSSNFINVRTALPANTQKSFSIYNSIGQLVQAGVYTGNSIDIGSLSAGVYSFLLQSEENISRALIVKE